MTAETVARFKRGDHIDDDELAELIAIYQTTVKIFLQLDLCPATMRELIRDLNTLQSMAHFRQETTIEGTHGHS